MPPSKPPVTGTDHPLPFDRLSGLDFERLCVWIVEEEGFTDVRHPGAAGNEQGRDILARRDGKQWAFQCKNVRQFGPRDAETEVDKLLELNDADLPDVYVFVVSRSVSEETYRTARAKLPSHIDCIVWDLSKLDRMVRRHRKVMKHFFQITGESPSSSHLDEEAIEAILRQYCQDRWQQWLKRRDPPADHTDTEHRLDHYVEPHFGILTSNQPQDAHGTTSQENGREHCAHEMKSSAYEFVDGVGNQAIVAFLKRTMLEGDNWLCLVEDAGAGKTVFSLRVEGLFSMPQSQQSLPGDKPWLAVRIEQWPRMMNDRRERVFLGICAALRRELQASVKLEDQDADAVVEYALEHRRAVLIVDALDQQEDGVLQILNDLRSDSRLRLQLRLVVTSRFYAVAEQLEQLFADSRWRYGRVELFDKNQQAEYLKDLDEGTLRQLIPDRERVAELLQFPVVLRMIRELLETRVPDEPLVPLNDRGDLYWRVSETLLRRAFKKQGRTMQDADLDILFKVLSVMAFQMTLHDKHRRNYGVPRGEIDSFREQAMMRFLGEDSRLHRVREKKWERAQEILKDTHLTDRCILEGNDENKLGFRSRKMMEFFAGVYLARFAEPGSVSEIRLLAANESLYWTWRFAIELPAEARHGETLCRSLAQLYEIPSQGSRPTELMFRCWHLFEREGIPAMDNKSLTEDLLPGADDVVHRWRWQFWDQFARTWNEAQRDEALRLFPEPLLLEILDTAEDDAFQRQEHTLRLTPQQVSELRRIVAPYRTTLEQRWQSDRERAYQACPPDSKSRTFWMGSSNAAWDQRPRHSVRVTPYVLQSFTVTDAQFGLFDPSAAARNKRNSTSDRPAVAVTWYDAWMFCKWLGVGFRLPTEAEWEFACQAGATMLYCSGMNPKYHGHYNTLGRSETTDRYRDGFGLAHMGGNVLEWCADWYTWDYDYRNSPMDDPSAPSAATHRVIHGRGYCDYYKELFHQVTEDTHWYSDGMHQAWQAHTGINTHRVIRGWNSTGYDDRICRSAMRSYDEPAKRGGYLGFRVVMVPPVSDQNPID